MISQFFCLSTRGDKILQRTFREDCTASASDVFFQKVQYSGNQHEPVFHHMGLNFAFIVRSSLFFGVVTPSNDSPFKLLKVLERLTQLFRDYCGVLSEDALRSNFILCYEILDECIDNGHIVNTSTEAVKPFIFRKPIETHSKTDRSSVTITAKGKSKEIRRTVGSAAANKSVANKNSNEVFIDLVERLTVTLGSTGQVLRSEVDGSLQLRSFLKGNQELRLGINNTISADRTGPSNGAISFDDVSFHDNVNLTEFKRSNMICMTPPEGEFVAMTYHQNGGFRLPFDVNANVTVRDDDALEFSFRLKTSFPDNIRTSHLNVSIPVPKSTETCSVQPSPSPDFEFGYNNEKKMIEVKGTKLQGGHELFINAKVFLPKKENLSHLRREVGPVNVDFELPMYNMANVQLEAIKVFDRGNLVSPTRWVRYLTYSNSFQVRCT